MAVILCVLFLYFFKCASSCDSIVMLKSNGSTIVGQRQHTVFENKPYAAFWKVPYAEPPVKELRFKSPKQHLIGFDQLTYDFSKPHNDTCSSGLTEDCLYLSIYMPTSDNSTALPVLVWLHEHSNMHAPDFLIDEDVIVVTVSYRTSILGFLNTQDDFAYGNMGAKDVIMALRWIREYILLFNGDVNRVTVAGSGASGNIVGALLVSPAAEDLFSRVVVQSGSALDAADYKNYSDEILRTLHGRFKRRDDDFDRDKLKEMLSDATIKRLLSVSEEVFDSSQVRDTQRLINTFGPTTEVLNKHAFMNKHPAEVYRRGMSNNNIDVMMGYTSLENIYKLKGFVKNRKLLKYLNYNFQYLLPFEGRRDEYNSKRYRRIAKKIMDFYFVNGTIGERSLRRYAKYLSDQVIYPLLRQARLHAAASCANVYLYRFKYKGSLNIGWNSVRNLNYSGATARDEICYLFRCKSANDIYRSPEPTERQFIKKIARLWANFAKRGNPTPESDDKLLENLNWMPLVRDQDVKVMNLAKKLKMINLPEKKRMLFWDDLRNEYFLDEMRQEEL